MLVHFAYNIIALDFNTNKEVKEVNIGSEKKFKTILSKAVIDFYFQDYEIEIYTDTTDVDGKSLFIGIGVIKLPTYHVMINMVPSVYLNDDVSEDIYEYRLQSLKSTYHNALTAIINGALEDDDYTVIFSSFMEHWNQLNLPFNNE